MSTEDRLQALETRLRFAEDRLEIIQLLSSYGPGVDSGATEFAASLWTEDGAYDLGGYYRSVGREAIAAMYSGEGLESFLRRGLTHITSTPRILLDGDTAEAIAHSLVILCDDNRHHISRAAANYWSLRRTEEGWRIETRLNRVLDGSPEAGALFMRCLG